MISTSIKDFYIKKAEKEDSRLILYFIKQLAIYEKLAHQVVATEAELEKHLFGEISKAEVVIAYFGETPVGFALYFHNFSTFLAKPGIYLEDLFVLEEYRGKGFGKALLSYLAHLAIDRDCGRLEWAVLDWNKPSIDFYRSLGAEPLDEWIVNRLTGNSLKRLADQF